MCKYSGFKQTFEMPPFDRAEPLKLVVTTTAPNPDLDFIMSSIVSVGVGGQWFDTLPVDRNGFRSESVCLGPAAFGGPVEFFVGTFGGLPCSSGSKGVVRVDQVAVQVAGPGECPMPGTVVNGDFQAAAGWTFQVAQSATGAIVANVGENGTRGAQLVLPNVCSNARAVGTIALPADGVIANPAVDVFWNGPSGRRLVVELGGKPIGTLNANGTAKHSRVCVPKWAFGTSPTISFFAQQSQFTACAALNPVRTFTLDNVTIVNEPACSASDVTDAGFERVANTTGPMPGWGLVNGQVNDLEPGIVTVLNSPGQAHTGNGVLRTSVSNECIDFDETGADLDVIVPRAQGASGPAVKFFASVSVSNSKSETRVTLLPATRQHEAPHFTVPRTGAFAKHTFCLPPALSGRRATVRFTTADPDGGGCATVLPTEVGLFDDVEVTTDAACPAQ
jgi:hypothetical protein